MKVSLVEMWKSGGLYNTLVLHPQALAAVAVAELVLTVDDALTMHSCFQSWR
jgi:hypothetical protein